MEIKDKLYEGKAKIIYSTDSPKLVVFEFKNSATAFDGEKKGTILDKGKINLKISAMLFRLLESRGIKTHLEKELDDTHLVVKNLDMIPVEAVVRNIAAGSLVKRLGIKEGTEMKKPIVEFYLKNDELHDPMINEMHAREMGLASWEELEKMKEVSLRVNGVLSSFLLEKGIRLVDFKLEFGRLDGEILLGDEISPDSCRLWDVSTGEKLDKDRFRFDLGRVDESYAELSRRICNAG